MLALLSRKPWVWKITTIISCRHATWSPPHIEVGSQFSHGAVPAGLLYSTDFVTPAEEAELIDILHHGLWLRHLKYRAQQFFGLVYYHTTHDMPALQPAGSREQCGQPLRLLPPWLLPRILSTGAFARLDEINQVAVNEYKGNGGIAPHVEDPTCFGGTLATLSLLAPVHLTLTPADQTSHGSNRPDHNNWVKILLEPRSLLVLQGESRYGFRHGIRSTKLVKLRDGTTIRRNNNYCRISLTFRELLETRRKLPCGVTNRNHRMQY